MEVKHLNDTGTLWLIGKIKAALALKVDKQDGKGLSENDFSTALKQKYDNAAQKVETLEAAGGEPNALEKIAVNGTDVAPDSDKRVNITVPTQDGIKAQIEAYGYKTGNDVEAAITAKGYQTAAQVQALIASEIGSVTEIDIQVVSSLPKTGAKGVIYLVAHAHTDASDVYDEYVWVEATSKFEKIGNTDIDLSQYVKSADMVDVTVAELEAMWNS